ncbi:MAG: TetR/AcrR family transcriptional regulator [Solirubrobacteraceae bacterium]
MVQRGRKSTQRERLLAGMVAVANRGGYAAANVSAVIGEAGVSRPTFYDYFEDRDACFAASIEDVQDQLAAQVAEAIAKRAPEQALGAAIETLVAFASAQPARARFLSGEALAGGASARRVRDQGIAKMAEQIEATLAGAPEETAAPDVEHRVLLGGLYRVLATRLRRGEPAISRLTDELQAWIKTYDRPLGEHRWETLAPAAPGARSPFVPQEPIQRMDNVLPVGRPRISEEEVAENHRLRILYAAARMAEQKGYIATTVADITKLARVDGHVFYRLFKDKQDAFLSAHELGFAQVMDVTSKAFFACETWPQRSWEAGRALTQLLQDNPLVAHVGFVEAHSVGPAAIQRIEDSHVAFTFFLQEGLVYGAPPVAPSRLAMEAIIACIFEIIYLQASEHGTPQVAAMLPHIAHLWLTPFLGNERSDEFIDAQITDG